MRSLDSQHDKLKEMRGWKTQILLLQSECWLLDAARSYAPNCAGSGKKTLSHYFADDFGGSFLSGSSWNCM